ncbi:unnamed protein product, partial [Mesorhabditis spiculigera]
MKQLAWLIGSSWILHDSNENSPQKSKKKSEEKQTQSLAVMSIQNIGIWMATMLIPCLAVVYGISGRADGLKRAAEDIQCYNTCRLRVAESIPVNISFPGAMMPETTFEAWMRLISHAENGLVIAAYKSSLQGHHVLDPIDLHFSIEGDTIFQQLKERGAEIDIQMIESFPPKDRGDNEDGNILERLGLLNRRKLEMKRALKRDGKMHSKFLMADDKHFYMGSANLDWRSLNQKMELGFVVEDCPCLGKDLRSIFDTYWRLSVGDSVSAAARYNKEKPLHMSIDGAETEAFIAASPQILNAGQRTWDLEALVDMLDSAREFVHVHVMDYHPIFVYGRGKELWPTLDDALRRAVARGVHVRVLSAAIHHPEIGIRFLKSLQDLDGINRNGSVQVKIFKVPPPPAATSSVIIRDRRTHNKVVVTEEAAAVGTSNWSGDYFEGGTTGTAIVIRQRGDQRPLIQQLSSIFFRNWNSKYAHPVHEYFEHCIRRREADFCETEKDPRLFDHRKY